MSTAEQWPAERESCRLEPRAEKRQEQMSQFKTFVLARDADDAQEMELNAFLRAHRVVSIAKVYDAGAWSFCVEWIEGKTGESLSGRGNKWELYT